MSERKILINCSELGAGTRGSSTFYTALENLAKKYPNTQYSKSSKILVENYNSQLNMTNFKHALRIEEIYKTNENILKETIPLLNNNSFTLILSADHSNAIGTIASIKSVYPNKKLGVIWIDAHYDLHTPYTTPSGNMHGMPLSASLGLDNLDCKNNDIEEECKLYWEKIKGLDTNNNQTYNKILPENLVFLGVRDFEKEEEFLIEKYKIKNFSVEKARQLGIQNLANYLLDFYIDCDLIYISLDVDSMDPEEVSYGTGTPVKNGFLKNEIIDLLNVLLKSDKVVATEIVEINPLLDDENQTMVKTSFEIINNILEKKYEN